MKRLIFVILLLFCTGCSAGVDVEDSSIVAGIALDKGTEKQYKMTLEIVSTHTEGQEAFDASRILSNEGDSLLECLRNIVTVGTKNLFFGHCRVLMFGEDLAREGIFDVLHTLLHDDQIRLDTEVIFAEGRAGDLLTKKSVTMPIRSYEMVSMIENIADKMGCCDHVRAYELFHVIETPGLDAMIPVFGIEDNRDPTFQYRGNAVLAEDKLVGFVNHKTGVLVRMLRGQLESGILEDAATEIFSCKTVSDMKQTSRGYDLFYTVDLHVGVYEWDGHEEPNTAGEIAAMERILAAYVQQELVAAVREVCSVYGNDVFGLGNRIYRQDAEGWQALESGYENPLEAVNLGVRVRVDLRSSGRAGNLR